MDYRTGQLYEVSDDFRKFLESIPRDERRFFRQVTPTPKQRKRGKVKQNEPCPCGSGKKFKKCCLVR